MANEHKPRPSVGVGIYLFNGNNELLLMKRESANGGGTWSPAGGHLEFGETFEECVRREAKEEWGIDLGNLWLLGITNDVYQGNKHCVTFHYAVKVKEGEPKIVERHNFSTIGWFKLGKLPQPLFAPVANLFKTNFDCFCGSGIKFGQCCGSNQSPR